MLVKALGYVLSLVPSGPTTKPSGHQRSQRATVKGPLLSAVQLLEQAASKNNSDALYILADLNFFGNYSHPRNLATAFGHYKQLAMTHGNATAQYMMGLYYSTGLGGAVPRNQAMALLYYTFAAVQGEVRAEMATAFRHHSGIGAVSSCTTAIKYYRRVAGKAIDWYRSGPPGGMSWVQQGWRLADDYGGVYGEGASASSAGVHALKAAPQSDAYAAIGDVMEYLDFLSRKGEWTATLDLGRRYYEGRRGLQRDFDLARKYFLLVASKYWKRDGRVVDNHRSDVVSVASRAAGYIGMMYLRGEGVPQTFDRAKVWFERGVTLGDSISQYGLGLMLLRGYGGKENIKKAVELLRTSAEQDYAPAHVQMGRLYLDQGGPEEVRIANNHFELAARWGNIEAIYYLAEMVYHGVGREKICSTALSYYKSVSERAEPLVSSWSDANEAYYSGDLETAFLEYLMAAEQGYEKAQTNVAWMLDASGSKLPLPDWLLLKQQPAGLLDNPELALIFWTRSSRQSNIDSLVKMGDYYLDGIGAKAEVSKAVQCYTGASDYAQSAQAIFNLGWMHENGIGLKQDFHLAKRYYDHALEVNEEAFLPVTLSLLKLRVRSAWNTLTNGPVHSIQDDPGKFACPAGVPGGKEREVRGEWTRQTPVPLPSNPNDGVCFTDTLFSGPKRDWSLTEWVANFLDAEDYEYDEHYRDSIYDGTIGSGEEYDEDSGLVESLLIIVISLSLVALLWWRQRLQEAHAQAEEARRREQGLPPAPPREDAAAAAFRGWAAGGIGL